MDAIGVDIAKHKVNLAWLSKGKLKTKAFENTDTGHAEMLAWLRKNLLTRENCHLTMEAASRYQEPVALALSDAGYKVSVVDPAEIKAFGESLGGPQKTDATLIARFCDACNPPAWHAAPPEVRELQRLLARVETLESIYEQERARRHDAQDVILDSIERVSDFLDLEVGQLELEIEEHLDRHPALREHDALLHRQRGV